MKTQLHNASVKLKGVGNHLCLIIDPGQPQDTVIQETEQLFKKLKNLAKDANVVIDFGDHPEDDQLKDRVAQALTKFHVASVITREELASTDFRMEGIGSDSLQKRSEVLMLAGRVRAGQRVSARNHLMILGDVNPGAEVVAGGDIIVMGSLHGKALAGQPDNHEAIVIAINFQPIQISIGHVMAAGFTGKMPTETQRVEFAHVEADRIVVEDYVKRNPFKRITWPKIR